MKRIMGYALLCAPFMLLFVLYGLAVVLSVYGIDPFALINLLSKPAQVAVKVIALPLSIGSVIGWLWFWSWSLKKSCEWITQGNAE